MQLKDDGIIQWSPQECVIYAGAVMLGLFSSLKQSCLKYFQKKETVSWEILSIVHVKIGQFLRNLKFSL